MPAPYRMSALCDVCQQNPKVNTYNYCSQTCASIAATLCPHCRRRPKSGNLDYCGTCRNTESRYSTHDGVTVNSQTFARAQSVVGVPHPVMNVSNYPSASASPPFAYPPMSWSQAPTVPPTPNPRISTPIQLQPGRRRPLSEVPRKHPQYGNGPVAQIPKSLAPGFKEYVRVNNGMATSNYSSKILVEQVKPHEMEVCIMCQRDPQREKDRFCSQFCKERAMTKG